MKSAVELAQQGRVKEAYEMVLAGSWGGHNVKKKFGSLRQVIAFLEKVDRAFEDPDDHDDFHAFKVSLSHGTWTVEYDVMDFAKDRYPK